MIAEQRYDTLSDFRFQISALEFGNPCTSGSFGTVYRGTINTNEGTKEVAVKVFKIDSGRAVEKYEKAMRRELKVWLRLSKHPTIVPLLGIAHVGLPLPVLISQWMPSGTLYTYLEQPINTITASNKVELVRGVADGLGYLHSENVVHGDLHPANVLVDGMGNPRLTDFGLATVVGDAELQLGTTTVTREFDVRWRAPEVIGVDPKDEPVRPNFKSDIYSFGGVMFFIVSGDIPWKEKKQPHIIIELSKRATPARPDNISDDHWNLIQKCWSWNPDDRPEATEITCSDIHDDFTSQISALKLGNPCKSGSFATVYQFTIETSEGTKEVAVKVFKTDSGRAVEKYVRAMRRELNVWIRVSKHQNIVPLLGTADVESPCPALVSQWMPSGTLDTYLEKHGTITTLAKAHLVRGVADGLGYLHSENVVHGDLYPANVLVDGAGNPRLTDFGLATVVGDPELQLGTTTAAREFNVRWRAPEVIGVDRKGRPVRPNFKSDIYSFGGVMLFIVSGDIPWKEKAHPQIIIELSKRATPARPDNISDDHWNLIQKCWSWNSADRPEAAEVIGCLATKITRPKTIVLFGDTGAGKSSLVNLMADKEVACTSSDMRRCTMQWKDYAIDFGGDSYTVFDTIGLHEPQLGIKEYLKSVENVYRLIKELDGRGGIDLLLFCVRAGRVTATLQSNYRLFHEFLCEKKVPIVLAITNLEREQRMETWWERNQSTFDKYQIQVAGHACVTAANKLDGRHRHLYEESRITIRNLVQQFTADGQKQAWIGGNNLFVSLMRKLRDLVPEGQNARKKDLVPHLAKRCGVSPDVAKQLADMIRQDVY